MLALLVLLASATGVAAPPVDAPITSATVYSDRALVTRTASLHLSGRTLVAFPVLPARASPASIRLESIGGDVEGITVARVTEDELPIDEARALLDSIDAIDRQIELANGAHRALTEIHDVLAGLSPVPPDSAESVPPPRMDPSGWPVAMSFLAKSTESFQTRLASTERRVSELREQRLPLAEKARALGAVHPLGGQRVLATVSGKGAVRLALSYEVLGARWYPTYDIQLSPARNQVAIAFVGLVAQETGEDWTGTQLTLSTAVPAQSSALPKLTAWRLGSRERFEPTPRPEPPQVSPPPPSPPPMPVARDEVRQLRMLLAAAAGANQDVDKAREGGAPKRDQRISGVAASPMSASPIAYARRAKIAEALEVEGAPAPRESNAEDESDSISDLSATVGVKEMLRASESASLSRPRRIRPVHPVNIAPPAAYAYPRFAANLPAALAAGHDLAFPAAARESVASGKDARRVALFSQTWPVSVERLLFPALAKQAYLVAEIKNPSRQALPGGQAHLFVGDDPAGVANLKFVAPGEKLTLPLGIDQAVKPIRNVTQSTVETGLISKDEVTEYTTTIEFANPYAWPIAVRVQDQIPVTADKDRAEVKFLGSDPGGKLTAESGALEWRMRVAAGATTKLKFVYSIKRPKGARLVQQ